MFIQSFIHVQKCIACQPSFSLWPHALWPHAPRQTKLYHDSEVRHSV